jgi:hypothetical protein
MGVGFGGEYTGVVDGGVGLCSGTGTGVDGGLCSGTGAGAGAGLCSGTPTAGGLLVTGGTEWPWP